MKKHTETYIDINGRVWDLTSLDLDERRLCEELQRRAQTHPDWNDFDNYWMPRVASLYDRRGLPRATSSRKPVYKIAQDLSARIALALGLVRLPDYRDDLDEIIREKFNTQRAFCETTGIAEDMLSHVLARRKHLAIDTLTNALGRIGYRLCILPAEP